MCTTLVAVISSSSSGPLAVPFTHRRYWLFNDGATPRRIIAYGWDGVTHLRGCRGRCSSPRGGLVGPQSISLSIYNDQEK